MLEIALNFQSISMKNIWTDCSFNMPLDMGIITTENRIKTGVFVKHECPRQQPSPKLAIFSLKPDIGKRVFPTFTASG